jgi:hypothetical protein
MRTQATAFDYQGYDRAQLFRFGQWLNDVLSRRSIAELRDLAVATTHGRYEDLIGLVRLLRQPGPRLVLFEDKALPLSNVIRRVIYEERRSLGDEIGQLAAPLLRDIDGYIQDAMIEESKKPSR